MSQMRSGQIKIRKDKGVNNPSQRRRSYRKMTISPFLSLLDVVPLLYSYEQLPSTLELTASTLVVSGSHSPIPHDQVVDRQYKLLLHSDYIPLQPGHMSAADAAHATLSLLLPQATPNISSARRPALHRVPSAWAANLSAEATYGYIAAASKTMIAHRLGQKYVLCRHGSYVPVPATESDCLSVQLRWTQGSSLGARQSTCRC